MQKRLCALVFLLFVAQPAFAATTLSCEKQKAAAALRVPILMYHHVRDYPNSKDKLGMRLSVSPKQFAAQLDSFKLAGYTTVHFADFTIPEVPSLKPMILTFDDGYDNAVTTILPLLKARGMTGTFFIITGKIGMPGYMTSADLSTMLAAGMELAPHTVTHPDLSRLSTAKQGREITQSADFIAKFTGKPVSVFAYPYGKYTAATERLVQSAGIPFAVTTHHGIADLRKNNHRTLVRLRVDNGTRVASLAKALAHSSVRCK